MNCQLCQTELDGYCEGRLPDNIRNQVEKHLGSCVKCAESFRMITLSNRIFKEERELQSNPLLSSRIMAEIENREKFVPEKETVFARVIRPALIMGSMAAAIFTGIVLGNFSGNSQNTIPDELAMIDDSAIESIIMLTNE